MRSFDPPVILKFLMDVPGKWIDCNGMISACFACDSRISDSALILHPLALILDLDSSVTQAYARRERHR